MPDTQPDQDGEIQAFHRWLSSTQRQGIGGSSHATQCKYIPPSAVKEYLGADHRVESLLTSLFKEANKSIDAEVIREHYLRPLAILLLIGEGHMIKHFVQYRSLQDHQLPYRDRPQDFPFSTDPTFFERFSNQQWQFCAADLEYNMNLHLHKEEILPITGKEEIGSGGNAVIYKISVDGEYNKLIPPRWKMPERLPHLRNTFVLKTYWGPDAKDQHRAERDAFMNLRYNNTPTPCVIAYYGSFIDDGTYNIILEFADRGTLEEYMETTSKPTSIEDMIEFWDRLSDISHGLAFIHGSPGDPTTGIPVLLGSLQYEVSDRDAFGTRAYGAPETLQHRGGPLPPLPGLVKPDVDVWSVACCFSEAAVWTRFGWDWVLNYRQQRQMEVKEILGLHGEHFFHDGQNVLPVVQSMHKYIAKEAREIDNITIGILRLLDENMLLKGDESRLSAKQVYSRSKRVISVAREKHHDNFRVTSDQDERPKTPPYVPPGYVRDSRVFSHSPMSPRASHPSSPRPILISNGMSYPTRPQGITSRNYYTRAVNGNISDHQNDDSFGSFHSDPIGLHELPDPPSPATSYQSSHFDRFKSLSINTQDSGHTQGHRRQHRETMGETPNRVDSIAPEKASLRRSKTEKSSRQPRPCSVESNSRYPADVSLPVSENMPLTPPRSSTSNHQSSTPTLDNEHYSEPEGGTHQREQKRPYLSLEEGLQWKERKKRGYPALLSGQENLTYLNERDHIFVIDNTESMRAYRTNVFKVVSLLAYMLKESDRNGLDVYFTQSSTKVNSGKSTKLLAAIGQATFQGISDMRARLSHILQEHKNKFGTSTALSGSWYKKSASAETQKPLSFYILTDGNWQPNDLGPVIKALVKSMKASQLPKEHIGIQFIRFGNDPRGIDRLTRLDRGLGLKKDDM
ncbi:MAG: hypothetical protein Q9190_006661 [Brigantiaea leucoxantha]